MGKKKYISTDGKIFTKKIASAAVYDYDRNTAAITIENVTTQDQRKKIVAEVKKVLCARTGEGTMANQAKKSPTIQSKNGVVEISLADGWLTDKQSGAIMALLVKAMEKDIHYAIYKNGKTPNQNKEAEPKTAPEPEPEQEPQPEPEPAPTPEPESDPEPEPPAPEPPAPEAPQDESEPTQEPPASEPPAPESKPLYYEDKPIDRAGIRAMMRKAAGLDPNK